MKDAVCVINFIIIAAAAIPVLKRRPAHETHNISTNLLSFEDNDKELTALNRNLRNIPAKRQLHGFGYENNFGLITGNENNNVRFNYEDGIPNLNLPKHIKSTPFSNDYRDIFLQHDAHSQPFTPMNANSNERNVARHSLHQNAPNLFTGTHSKFSLPEPENFFNNYLRLNPDHQVHSKNIRQENSGTFTNKRPQFNGNIFLHPNIESPNFFNPNNHLGKFIFPNLGVATPSQHPGNAASFSSITHYDRPIFQNFPTAAPQIFPNSYKNIHPTPLASPENVFLVRGNEKSNINTNKARTHASAPILLVIPQQGVQISSYKPQSQSVNNQHSSSVPAKNAGYTAEYSEQVRPFESQPVANTGGYGQHHKNPTLPSSSFALHLVTTENMANPHKYTSFAAPFANIPPNVVVVDNNVHTASGTIIPTSPLIGGNVVQGTSNSVRYPTGSLSPGGVTSENGWRGTVPNNVHQTQAISSLPFAPNGYHFGSNGNGNQVRQTVGVPPVLILAPQVEYPKIPINSNQMHHPPAVLLNFDSNRSNSSRSTNSFVGNFHPVPNHISYTGFSSHVSNGGTTQRIVPGNLLFGDQKDVNTNVHAFENVYSDPSHHPSVGRNVLYRNNPFDFPPLFYSDPQRFSAFNQGQLVLDQENQNPVRLFNEGRLSPQHHGNIPNNLNKLVLIYSNLPLDVSPLGVNKLNNNSSNLRNTQNAEFNLSQSSSLPTDNNIPVGKRFSDNISDDKKQSYLKPSAEKASPKDNILISPDTSSVYEIPKSHFEGSASKKVHFAEIIQTSNSPFDESSRRLLDKNIHESKNLKPSSQGKNGGSICSKTNNKSKRSPNCNMLGSDVTSERLSRKDIAKLIIQYGERLPVNIRV